VTTEQKIKQAINQGAFDSAISMANDALNDITDVPQKVAMLYILAVATRLQGSLDNAIAVNNEIIKLQANHARAYQELGHAYRQMNNALASAKNFYQATQLNPALIASWKALLAHYQQTENHSAAKLTQTQITYLSTLPKALMHARDLMYEGQLQQADQLCRKFLQGQKHDPEGMLLLAEIGIALKAYSDAEFLLESCLTLHPEHTATGIEYLKLLAKMGRFQAANEWAERLLKTRPSHPIILNAKASALVGLGEIDQAIAIYQQLLLNTPEQAGLYLRLGHAYKASGNYQKAVASYQQAYLNKPDFGDAYWSLANTKTYAFNHAELDSMKQQTKRDISTEDKIHFCFALGKAYEDKKSFDDSFAFYAKGNALRLAQTGYQPETFEQQVINHKRVFTPTLFANLANVGADANDPIFIVGLPRAGSTLLEQILASHSQVDGTMELHNILGLAARLRGQNNRYPEILNELDKDYFERFGQQYLQDTSVYRSSAPLFIDKMPNNFLHIGLIKLILPNAKVIDARREPMACCFSGFKQLFAEGQEFTYGLQNIGRYYRAYMDMMQHWEAVLPEFVLQVQHEQVIDDLEGQVKRILAFCGLEFEASCVDFHKTKRTIKTPSSEQVRQPIFKDSMLQHTHYQRHLGPLREIVAPFIPATLS
jgi:tetratricopeptide (TPR) repeat protein